MVSNSSSTGGGIGFFGLLGVAFIVLKLTDYISWPWWVVLMPIWIPILIAVVGIVVVLVIYMINK